MTNKLNFDSKKNRILGLFSLIFLVVMVNYLISTIPFSADAKSVEINCVEVIRDKNYAGGNPDRDWNSIIIADVKPKNIFLKPKTDSFLVSIDQNSLSGYMEYSFSGFNIFKYSKNPVPIKQSILIDNDVSELTFKFKGSAEEIPVEIY